MSSINRREVKHPGRPSHIRVRYREFGGIKIGVMSAAMMVERGARTKGMGMMERFGTTPNIPKRNALKVEE